VAIFRRIRVIGEVAQNDTSGTPRTIYALTPEELAALNHALREAFDRWLEAVADGSYRTHWYAQFDAEAAQLGLAQTVANLTALSPVYSASRDIGSALMSQGFQNRVAMAQIKSYEHWTGLSAGEKSALSQIIGRAVVDGKNPRAVVAEIQERMGVSRSRAEQYVQTDITDTLRMTRLDERDWAVENLGMSIGLLWKSALIPTTRPTHAIRNGRTYTSAEVRQFYAGPERYRCHCSVTEVLLDEEGRPMLTDRAKETSRVELAAWQKQQRAKR
jgi:SPP1 gp7 family putative phage head morphogenesis protein